jgi:hypothetical protein
LQEIKFAKSIVPSWRDLSSLTTQPLSPELIRYFLFYLIWCNSQKLIFDNRENKQFTKTGKTGIYSRETDKASGRIDEQTKH